MFWHQQSKRSTSTSRTLKSTPAAPPPLFLRTPKLSLRHMRRKNNFGVLCPPLCGGNLLPPHSRQIGVYFCCLRLIKSQAVSMLFAALSPNRPTALEHPREMADSCRYRLGVSPRFTLLHSAPLSGIEVLTGIITGVCRKEVVSILQRKQRNVAALTFEAFRRKECYGKGMLIIIRNKPALDSIADGFPSLVVLVIHPAG